MMYAATARELYTIEAEQKRAAHLQAFKKKLRKRMLTAYTQEATEPFDTRPERAQPSKGRPP
jgi:hypothetical protein